MLIMAHDFTERNSAAVALENSEATLAAAQRIAHLGSWELDLKNIEDINANELRWSDETFRIFGLKPKQVQVTQDLFFRFVHADDRPRVAAVFIAAVKNRQPYDIEHR